MLSPDESCAARELFNAKRATLHSHVRYRSRRLGLSDQEFEDALQECLMRLWTTCVSWVTSGRSDEISCSIVAMEGLKRRTFDRGSYTVGRPTTAFSQLGRADDPPTFPATTTQIRVDETTLTLADARAEHGCFDYPITLAEAASIVGVTSEAVRLQADRLGGVRVGRRWVFSRDRVEAAARARSARLAGGN